MEDERRQARRTYLVGVVLLLATAALWSLNGALIKITYDDGRGVSAVNIAFYRSLIAGVFLFPLAWGKFHTLRRRPGAHKRGAPAAKSPDAAADPPPTAAGTADATASPSLTTAPHPVQPADGLPSDRRPLLLSLRPAAVSCVIFFTLMTACFVLATTMTEAGNAIILQYTSAFWIFGFAPLVLGEKPRGRDLWLLGLAMGGIAIIFAGRMSTDLPGLTIALASGLFFGLETLMIRRMRDSDSAAVIVLNLLGSALLLLPVAWLVGGLAVSPRAWMLLLALGVIQFGVPYYLFALALVRVPAHHAALITLAEPVLNPLWTYLAVDEIIPMTTIIGGAVILLALGLFLRTTRTGGADIAAPVS